MMNIEKPTIEEKHLFRTTYGKDTYIAMYSSDTFIRTSCILTAAVLRYRLTGHLEFTYIPEQLTPEFLARTPLFQIAFGEDYSDHIITVYNGIIYQSFYRETEWDVRPFDISHFSPDIISAKSLSQLIGYTLDDFPAYPYTIFVPPAKEK